uniref:ZP domain-containing protein n=1 Tax=Ditylenchus dipsaci TaxID=166011 RepID=A0A915DB08_9BILA
MICAQQHPYQQNYFLSDKVEGLDAARIIGTPRVKCNTKWLTLDLETNVPFQGRIYVNGKAFDRRCSAQFILNQMPNATVQIPIIDCANLEELNKSSNQKGMTSYLVWVDVRVDFHPIFVTKTSQVFRAECTEVSGLDYRDEDKRIGQPILSVLMILVNSKILEPLTKTGK